MINPHYPWFQKLSFHVLNPSSVCLFKMDEALLYCNQIDFSLLQFTFKEIKVMRHMFESLITTQYQIHVLHQLRSKSFIVLDIYVRDAVVR